MAGTPVIIDDLRELTRAPHISTPATIPPDDNICYHCRREYGTQEDLTDAPCQAIQFHPCGHLVGDRCYAVFPPHFKHRCQYCTQPIDNLIVVPKWLAMCLWTDSWPIDDRLKALLDALLPGEHLSPGAEILDC